MKKRITKTTKKKVAKTTKKKATKKKAKIPNRPRIAIFFDTNFFWTKTKSHLISKNLEELKSTFGKNLILSLYIPKIVQDELSYQAVRTAISMYKGLVDKHRLFNGVTTFNLLTEVNEEEIKSKIISLYDELIIRENISVLTPPIDELDISEMIENSVWRIGVFEEKRTSKQGEEYKVSEKGFRDHIILKTFENIIDDFSRYKNILFVTDDDLLKKEVEKIDDNRIIVAEKEEVGSILTSIVSNVEDVWKKNLLPLAASCFFEKGKETSFYYSNVNTEIDNQFGQKIKSLSPLSSNDVSNAALWNMEWTYQGVTHYIGNPKFLQKVKNTYTWISDIKVEKTYKKIARQQSGFLGNVSVRGIPGSLDSSSFGSISNDSLLSSSSFGNISNESLLSSAYIPMLDEGPIEKTSSLNLIVKWTSEVDRYGNFTHLNLLSISSEDEN